MSFWGSLSTGLKSVSQKAGKVLEDVAQFVAPEGDSASSTPVVGGSTAARDVSCRISLDVQDLLFSTVGVA